MKICYAASSGGHLEQIMMLHPMMKKYKSVILTENTEYKFRTNDIKNYKVIQINRRELLFIIKLFLILIQSVYIWFKEKPDVVISTGALATIPISIIAKLTGKKLIFIESFSKIDTPTLTGRIMYKFADLFIVQWEGMLKHYPSAKYGGGIY